MDAYNANGLTVVEKKLVVTNEGREEAERAGRNMRLRHKLPHTK